MGGSAEWESQTFKHLLRRASLSNACGDQQTRSWDAHVKQVIGACEKGSEIFSIYEVEHVEKNNHVNFDERERRLLWLDRSQSLRP